MRSHLAGRLRQFLILAAVAPFAFAAVAAGAQRNERGSGEIDTKDLTSRQPLNLRFHSSEKDSITLKGSTYVVEC